MRTNPDKKDDKTDGSTFNTYVHDLFNGPPDGEDDEDDEDGGEDEPGEGGTDVSDEDQG